LRETLKTEIFLITWY